MKRVNLGRTDIEVSNYCLGTMTYGTQTAEVDAHDQIDRALAANIDFMDTAEMYPVNPMRAETVGLTEEIIGNWNAKTGRRKDWIIATKHSGPGSHSRDGAGISKGALNETIEGSLRRLQTDYIDLYQLHWPNRGSYAFRQNWSFDPRRQPSHTEIFDEMCGILEGMKALQDAGKIRAFGLSNESAWGTMKWLEAARATGGPRVSAVQNEYSLMCRLYDTDMGELSHHEDATLLAYSPLACGYLTGKYQNGKIPKASRKSITPDLFGRANTRADEVAQVYIKIAEKHNIDPVHLALSWVTQCPFSAIPIFGATTTAQLDHIIAGLDLTLSDEVLSEVSKAHRAHPMPY